MILHPDKKGPHRPNRRILSLTSGLLCALLACIAGTPLYAQPGTLTFVEVQKDDSAGVDGSGRIRQLAIDPGFDGITPRVSESDLHVRVGFRDGLVRKHSDRDGTAVLLLDTSFFLTSLRVENTNETSSFGET